MTLKQYKDAMGLSNKELTKELRKIQPELDEPLVSRMVSGIVGPSDAVKQYITREKPFAIRSNGLLEQEWVTIPFEEEMRSNKRFSEIYQIVAAASRDNPATYPRMCIRTGKSRRVIQSLISEMREQGVPIVSYTGHTGFWIAKDEKDMRDLIGMYEKQAKRSLLIANRLRRNCGGQLTWEDIARS